MDVTAGQSAAWSAARSGMRAEAANGAALAQMLSEAAEQARQITQAAPPQASVDSASPAPGPGQGLRVDIRA